MIVRRVETPHANIIQARQCTATATVPLRWRAISNVPTDRTKRAKDAKTEAQHEIDDYRNQKEEEFKVFEKEVRVSSRVEFNDTCYVRQAYR